MDDGPNAVLALEDGSVFRGTGFGARARVAGEVVFNTSMIGYPELLTDPSYYQQIVVMTYPIVGSYGVPPFSLCDEYGVPLHFESDSIKIQGYAVHSLSHPSHWSSERRLDEWMAQERIPGVQGLDTRALTRRIRTNGTMLGVLQVSDEPIDLQEITISLGEVVDPDKEDLVKAVSPSSPIHHVNNSDSTIVLVDCGVKYGILRSLLSSGVNVVRVPYDYSIGEILEFEPAGVVITNGPGDPKKCGATIETTKELLKTDIPIMGICLGMQILALAAGGDTYKLKFGHRAVNHPCLDLTSGRCYVTTQNHGFSVEAGSLDHTEFDVSFININDKTIEGIQHRHKNVFGVQWHPESSPGPYDTRFLIERFAKAANP